jgi:hypothetical protein
VHLDSSIIRSRRIASHRISPYFRRSPVLHLERWEFVHLRLAPRMSLLSFASLMWSIAH